ncbi:hypothetical protein VTO42DRAFT_3333 [Malbranchea cinnamomea]
MSASISFRNQIGARPPRYRTPSPPRHAVEPLSPHALPASVGARDPVYDSFYQPSSTHGQLSKFSMLEREHFHESCVADSRVASKAGHHARSGSTIDTLATIALATSPTFAPPVYNGVSEVMTHSAMPHDFQEQDELMERPLKRARSEKAPSPVWQRSGERPTTSHSSTFDSMKTDAELLLNFARPSNFPRSTEAAPKTHQEREDVWSIETKFSANLVRSQTYSRDAGVACTRARSRSDGSTMAIDDTTASSCSQPTHPPVLVESDVMGQSLSNRSLDFSPQRAQESMTISEGGATLPDSESGIETDASGQAQCASCNMARAPLAHGDDTGVTWVNCDGCNRWFHILCAGFRNDAEIRTVDKFICYECHPIHGPTTFLRKSSRPRTAIDYAGLNQGFVKPSTEAPEHHYIKPIKEGKISFLPDNFARLPPELVTAEYFQHGVGIAEPVVIPSHLNSHTPFSALGFIEDVIPSEARDQEEFDRIIDSLTTTAQNSKEVVDCGQDLLDMVIPDNLTVKTVSDLYGPHETVEVIDVKSQQGEDKKWTLQKWADYYYEAKSLKPIRNVISLEISQSPLGRLIRRPKIVRDLDLQDSVWPPELRAVGDYPKVQFYCLMSVADCYTDFHIDFGGSSVYYHILKGKKTFFFIPPKDKHLKKYEEWCNSSTQDTTFLGDQTKECYRVDLSEGDTMLIPSGWIHAVWTPEDSLVIGGNFLTRMDYAMQIKVAKIEKDTKVPMKFRYPFFQKIMWYAALKYLAEDPIPPSVLESFARDENYRFYREYPIYYEFGDRANTAAPGSDHYNSRFYSQAELDGLPELARYLLRTALIAGGYNVDGVAKEARNAVSRSIPKGYGDPIEIAQKFGIWVAWKRGNESAPKWTRPGSLSPDVKFDISEKKSNGHPNRRPKRNVRAMKTEQKGTVEATKQKLHSVNMKSGRSAVESSSMRMTPISAKRKAPMDVKTETEENIRSITKLSGIGSKRVACDACRRRRIRCRHKNEPTTEGISGVSSAMTSSSISVDGLRAIKRVSNVPASSSSNGITSQQPRSKDDALLQLERRSSHIKSSSASRVGFDKINGTIGSSFPPKKGRSKACTECRKSKRRCIHDEAGQIDPQKAQERVQTRTPGVLLKQVNSEDENENESFTKDSQDVSLKDDPEGSSQKLFIPSSYVDAMPFSTKDCDSTLKPAEPDAQVQIHGSYASSLALKPDSVASRENVATFTTPTTNASLVSPPTSLPDDIESAPPRVDGCLTISTHDKPSSRICAPSLLRPLNDVAAAETSPSPRFHVQHEDTNEMPTAGTRDFASLDGLTFPVVTVTEQTAQRWPSFRSSRGGSAKISLSTGRQNQDGSCLRSTSRNPKVMQRDKSRLNADPESLRLIRELQEQEFSLRKRATRP